jgi:hypothetical protein
MNYQMTYADNLRRVSLKVLWGVALFVLLIFGMGLSPIAAIAHFLENQGISDADKMAMAYAAGFTLPLFLGITIITYLVITGINRNYSSYTQVTAAALILLVTGWLSKAFSLGLSPRFGSTYTSGPIFISLPMYVATAYLSIYGLPLTIIGVTLGIAAAFSIERYQYAALHRG